MTDDGVAIDTMTDDGIAADTMTDDGVAAETMTDDGVYRDIETLNEKTIIGTTKTDRLV